MRFKVPTSPLTEQFTLATIQIEQLHLALKLANSSQQLKLRLREGVQDAMALFRNLVKP
jgi:hypothetical protein